MKSLNVKAKIFCFMLLAFMLTSSLAMAEGTFEFKWPGGDCWSIYRGDELLASYCGSVSRALEAGTYTIKPMNSDVFIPFQIPVKDFFTTTTQLI